MRFGSDYDIFTLNHVFCGKAITSRRGYHAAGCIWGAGGAAGRYEVFQVLTAADGADEVVRSVSEVFPVWNSSEQHCSAPPSEQFGSLRAQPACKGIDGDPFAEWPPPISRALRTGTDFRCSVLHKVG